MEADIISFLEIVEESKEDAPVVAEEQNSVEPEADNE
jgi:hypothetical protein